MSDFHRIFPSATYRVVHIETPTNEGKSPVNNLVYDYEDAMQFIFNSTLPYRLGWLVDSDHVVVDVDCDHKSDTGRDKAIRVARIIKDLGIRTIMYSTEHGMHCIFRRGDTNYKSVVKVMSALGVRIDIRAHGSYAILPLNDPKRRWWNGSSENMDEVPFFLRVVTKSRNLTETWGLRNGDGRNDVLFNLLKRMKSSQMSRFTSEEIKQSIELANKYILADPMTDRELYSTILRPENLEVKDKDSSINVTAEYAMLINNENDIMYAGGSFFMIKDDTNIYQKMSDDDMERFVYTHYTKALSSKNRKEVILALAYEAYTPWEDCNRDPYDIPFLNGVYNVKSGGFRPTLASDNLTYVLPHVYNPEIVKTDNSESFYRVSLEGSIDKRRFFSQMLGYSMTRSAEFQVFFIFKGRGGTGKSTLLDIVRRVLGMENISNLQLQDFNRQFGLDVLFNKLANIGDDISTSELVDSQSFKKASSGDVIHVDRKYKTSLDFAPFAKIIFSANSYPKIADKSRAMERRMRIVASDRVIPKDEIDPNFLRNLTEEDFAAIINEALFAFHMLLVGGAKVFPDPVESLEMKGHIRQLGDHVYSFVLSLCTRNTDSVKQVLDGLSVMAEYQQFRTFCLERGFKQPAVDSFREQIVNLLEYDIDIKFDDVSGLSTEVFKARMDYND